MLGLGIVSFGVWPGSAWSRRYANASAKIVRGSVTWEVTAIAGGAHATAADLADAKRIFDAVGVTVTLDEYQLDAVTGLSGSGPAYVFLLAEALIDAGVLVGLARPVAKQLAVQTLLGSARLLCGLPMLVQPRGRIAPRRRARLLRSPAA